MIPPPNALTETSSRLTHDLFGDPLEPITKKRRHTLVENLAVTEMLKESQSVLLSRMDRLENQLLELMRLLEIKRIEKEFYTTVEAAKILGKRPFTVREWCRLGRINAKRGTAGRGPDPEWRISHLELLRIQNEGLLPCPRSQ